MRCILLSGGSGKRLWPLSNDARSKQFLKILKTEDDRYESMVQRVWRQLSMAGLNEDSYIVTGRAQKEVLQAQLDTDATLIIEPERRDTFPAIALAAAYLYDKARCDPQEFICVLPVDPYVEDHFFERIKNLEDISKSSSADLFLLGAEPTYPSSKYGYILPDINATISPQKCYNVIKFMEKPSELEAANFIQQGALWNCGIFGFRLNYMIQILKDKGIPLSFEVLSERYNELPKISFDYEVVERCGSIMVIPYLGEWKDLGTWNTLTEEINDSVIGKGSIGKATDNTHIINELDLPVRVLGVSNAVIAVSPDGILVSDKASSPELKHMLKDDNERPMYEERLWGWHRILEYTKNSEDQEVLTKRICIKAGKNLSYQVHSQRTEIWIVISGVGEYIINGIRQPIRAGTVIQVEPGDKHAIRGESDLQLIEVQIGKMLVDDDILRLEADWDAIINNK